MFKKFGFLGSLFGFLAVFFGAFGAHSLKDHVSAKMLAVFQTGVQYQALHSIILILIAILSTKINYTKLILYAGWFFVLGIIIFSGSLYALVLTEIKSFGTITSLGGLSFLAGWGILMIIFNKININNN